MNNPKGMVFHTVQGASPDHIQMQKYKFTEAKSSRQKTTGKKNALQKIHLHTVASGSSSFSSNPTYVPHVKVSLSKTLNCSKCCIAKCVNVQWGTLHGTQRECVCEWVNRAALQSVVKAEKNYTHAAIYLCIYRAADRLNIVTNGIMQSAKRLSKYVNQ